MRKPNVRLFLSSLTLALPAAAQSNPATGGEAPTTAAPETARGPAAPLGLSKPPPGEEFRFDFHGYLRAPLRVGRGDRQGTVGENQSSTIFHEPLLLDDQYLNWNYTRAQEKAWAEMFFSYGNSHVTGTVSVQGYNFDDWERLSDGQFGIGQGWVTIHPDPGLENARFEWRVGSFWEKFGQAGKYDAGPYDTYIIGRTHQMGESLKGEYDVADGDITLKAEHGIGAHGEERSGSAFTLLHHFHVGASLYKLVDINLHYLNSWTQDSVGADPEGSIRVIGAEGRLTGGILGELYLGYSSVKATNALRVGPAIEVDHAFGGRYFGLGVLGNFLGSGGQDTSGTSGGNGTINTFEFNYEYSFGLLWRELEHPGVGFWGEGTDVRLNLYAMYTTVSTPDPNWDGIKKFKYGGDAFAAILPWFGAGVRYDRVQPNLDDGSVAFSIISPRLVFRTSWNSHEQVSLVYSHYSYGSAITGSPIANGTTHPGFVIPPSYGSNEAASGAFRYTGGASPINRPPDTDVITLKATMWW
jgi:hypothetical protein